MAEISPVDRVLVSRFRNGMVLQDAEGNLPSDGIILVTCGDGDEFPELFENMSGRMGRGSLPRIHLLALNGGPLNIPPLSLVNKKGEGAVILQNIRGARELKGIANVVLCAHAPCGAAASVGIGLTAIISLLLKAENEILSSQKNVSVSCFLHVDYGAGRKRTYSVSSKAWEVWMGT